MKNATKNTMFILLFTIMVGCIVVMAGSIYQSQISLKNIDTAAPQNNMESTTGCCQTDSETPGQFIAFRMLQLL
jgi:hypothetical protein